jgi:hypothetical protein
VPLGDAVLSVPHLRRNAIVETISSADLALQ